LAYSFIIQERDADVKFLFSEDAVSIWWVMPSLNWIRHS